MNNKNLYKEESLVSLNDRIKKNKHKAFTVWFTGLSGSGKSTICKNLELELFNKNKNVAWIDADTLRGSLNQDLGFSIKDREENIRRIANLAKILNDLGIIVLASFITPTEKSRELAKSIIGEDKYHLVYVNTPLEVCEKRDVKNLYLKARKGEIENFTGVSSKFEAPKNAILKVNTENVEINDSVFEVSKVVTKLLVS